MWAKYIIGNFEEFFEEASTFWAPKWPLLLLVPFKGPKKSQTPSKSLDFGKGPF
jgi:hypothetical protein